MTSDRNFFDRGVTLNYSIGDGPVQQVSMRYSGGQIYRGETPSAGCHGGVVIYHVEARDFANSLGVGETKFFLVSGGGGMPGDLNADAVVNSADGSILADVLLGIDVDAERVCRADVNNVGAVNGLDVAAFVAAAL